jgi:hypothetical protein
MLKWLSWMAAKNVVMPMDEERRNGRMELVSLAIIEIIRMERMTRNLIHRRLEGRLRALTHMCRLLLVDG